MGFLITWIVLELSMIEKCSNFAHFQFQILRKILNQMKIASDIFFQLFQKYVYFKFHQILFSRSPDLKMHADKQGLHAASLFNSNYRK